MCGRLVTTQKRVWCFRTRLSMQETWASCVAVKRSGRWIPAYQPKMSLQFKQRVFEFNYGQDTLTTECFENFP